MKKTSDILESPSKRIEGLQRQILAVSQAYNTQNLACAELSRRVTEHDMLIQCIAKVLTSEQQEQIKKLFTETVERLIEKKKELVEANSKEA